MEVDLSQMGEMVNKNKGSLVSLACQLAFSLGNKADLHADNLINGDALVWGHHDLDGIVACPIHSQSLSCECAKKASSTFWWLDLCKWLWGFSLVSQGLQHFEAAVPESVVPSQYLSFRVFCHPVWILFIIRKRKIKGEWTTLDAALEKW